MVRFDEMGDYGNHLLHYLQRNDPEEKIISLVQHSVVGNEKAVNLAFKDVCPLTKEKLTKIYSPDFDVLGYDIPAVLGT